MFKGNIFTKLSLFELFGQNHLDLLSLRSYQKPGNDENFCHACL